MDELDRVLGGGLVPGAVVLLAGEPGVGKSTLLLEAGALARSRGRCSTSPARSPRRRSGCARTGSGRSADQSLPGRRDRPVRRARARRSGAAAAADRRLGADHHRAPGSTGRPGGVTQVREVTAALMAVAKQRSLTTVLVGHVTKDGSIAGPRALEHLVDVVLHFDGDRHAQLRMVRALKNRFGPTDEVGCFELGEYGLIGLPDPSGLFVSQQREPVPGTCVTVTLEGRRPLLAEVQTLVAASDAGDPAPGHLRPGRPPGSPWCWPCSSAGPTSRSASSDVYAATVGGVRLTEPSVDLAVALALASAAADLSVPGSRGGHRRGRAGRRGPPGRRRGRAGWPRPSGWASGAPSCQRVRPGAGRGGRRRAGHRPGSTDRCAGGGGRQGGDSGRARRVTRTRSPCRGHTTATPRAPSLAGTVTAAAGMGGSRGHGWPG